jgi:nicotinate-nucleotide--dimethylbenzimidazole phosphoribosyltransferase
VNKIEWLNKSVAELEQADIDSASDRQNSLTKPPGSLGMLEEVAIRLSAMGRTDAPSLEKVNIVVFAADHGIAEENVSAFPQAVTAEMVKNFSAGGAAISVMAKELSAELEVVNVGTVSELDVMPGVLDQRIAAGTHSFYKQAAMSEDQLAQAFAAGYDAVQRAKTSSTNLFIAGDMGIANTSSATAIACAILGCTAKEVAGPGTGLSKAGVSHKVDIIQQSLDKHKLDPQQPLAVLQTVGGFEIAAMTAAYIACAQNKIPALVDGFIASAAALAAIKLNPQVNDWLFYAHASAEPGHKKIMQAMNAKPLIDLNLRLGEASGAAAVVPLMRMACALHNDMATFAQAGVSDAN